MESQTSPFRLVPYLGLVLVFLLGFAAVSYVRSIYASMFAADNTVIHSGQLNASQGGEGGKRSPGGSGGRPGAEDAEEGDADANAGEEAGSEEAGSEEAGASEESDADGDEG